MVAILAVTALSRAMALAAPAPVANATAADHPNDVGTEIDVTWTLSADDDIATPAVKGYEILRCDSADGDFTLIGTVAKGVSRYDDRKCERGRQYWYQVVAIGGDDSRSVPVATSAAATAVMQYVNRARLWFGLVLVVLSGGVVMFIRIVKGGGQLKIRKIAGLEAVEEAVGRATEMGRSILFIPGIQDVNEIQTIAGITVLSRIARLAAEHGADLEVPTSKSLVMTLARETVQEAYLSVGRPDAYNEDRIYYVTDEQFGYVAAVSGKMVREKPAACFYMGAFFAESLILAETGNHVGAIQIAGTAMPAQLPFFVAACDYTLIGEEFFAASAYLSGEPAQLGSLKGQDVGKFFAAVLMFVGCGVAALWGLTGSEGLRSTADFLVAALTSS
jgi:hypothetical protein